MLNSRLKPFFVIEGIINPPIADTAAAEIAIAVEAQGLIFLTDVDGIHDARGRRIPWLTMGSAKELLNSGAVSGGMIPKLKASIKALTAVPVVRIINAELPHALLQENSGGTTIVP